MKGKIYKMFLENDPKVYIGATTDDIGHRFLVHQNYIIKHKSKAYSYFNENMNNNLKCELLEEIEFDDPAELTYLEHNYIQQYKKDIGENNILNSRLVRENPLSLGGAKITENIKEYNRNYYHKINKDNLLQKLNCEVCNKKISKVNFIKHQASRKHKRNLINDVLKYDTDSEEEIINTDNENADTEEEEKQNF